MNSAVPTARELELRMTIIFISCIDFEMWECQCLLLIFSALLSDMPSVLLAVVSLVTDKEHL